MEGNKTCTEWSKALLAWLRGVLEGERMERDPLDKEWEHSSVFSGLESLQCCSHRPGEVILNIKSFILRSREVPEHLGTSPATPGWKGCSHFAAQDMEICHHAPFPLLSKAGNQLVNWEIHLLG